MCAWVWITHHCWGKLMHRGGRGAAKEPRVQEGKAVMAGVRATLRRIMKGF